MYFVFSKMKVYILFFLLCTVLMLRLENILKVYSGQAAIVCNLSLQKCFFLKVLLFLSPCVLSVAMVSKACDGRSTEAAKMTVTFRHMSFTGQMFENGFCGDVFF